MLISQGNLKVVLNEVKNEDDTTRAVWQAWLSDKLAGQVELSDWENSDVDFYSKQAGEILVDQFKETLAIAAELEDEASMEKTDDGVVKDIAPSPIESVEPEACCGQCDVPPGHDPCDETDSKKIIILHLNNLLDKAKELLLQKPGSNASPMSCAAANSKSAWFVNGSTMQIFALSISDCAVSVSKYARVSAEQLPTIVSRTSRSLNLANANHTCSNPLFLPIVCENQNSFSVPVLLTGNSPG